MWKLTPAVNMICVKRIKRRTIIALHSSVWLGVLGFLNLKLLLYHHGYVY